jgi:hypothetical protein
VVAAREPTEQLTVPFDPTGGVEQLDAGPVVWEIEVKVTPDGNGSVNVAFVAALGPLLVMPTEKAIVEPTVVEAGAVFEALMSDDCAAAEIATRDANTATHTPRII